MTRSYRQLKQFDTFLERFEYLKLTADVGSETFGPNRYLNQRFYKSLEWNRIRDYVIVRDNGCDLGITERPIHGRILIHHMNPVSELDIVEHSEKLLDPEFLICVSHDTHNAIHYGNAGNLLLDPVPRFPDDTCLWKRPT